MFVNFPVQSCSSACFELKAYDQDKALHKEIFTDRGGGRWKLMKYGHNQEKYGLSCLISRHQTNFHC